MKATSLVFPNVQKPLTVFGLPPKMMGLAALPAPLIYLACIILGWQPLALPGMLAGFAAGIVFVLGKVRADPHYENLILHARPRWRRRTVRRLLAGAPVETRGRR